MKLVVGAPVAERAWILPRWYECLAAQTLKPDAYCFVYSRSEDDTLGALHEWCPADAELYVRYSSLSFHSRDVRNTDPKDPNRVKHFCGLRNQLKTEFFKSDADVFVSLDTDILLEDPTVLEQLVATLQEGWEFASPLTYLHPWGARSKCYNAGQWTAGDPGSYTRIWERVTEDTVRAYKPPIKIDIPMAVIAGTRWAWGMCRYQPHECGEDCGFADTISKHRLSVAWRTDLQVRHVWAPDYLDDPNFFADAIPA